MADWWDKLLKQRWLDGRSDAEKDVFDWPYVDDGDPQNQAENEMYKRGFDARRLEIRIALNKAEQSHD